MKKVLLSISVISSIMLFSGCTYHSKSLEYAKKHKLSEEIYSDVKIQCITNDKLNGNSIQLNITKAIGTSMYNTCDYDSRSMRQTHPTMGMRKYQACIGLANSTKVFSIPKKVNSTTTINHIQTKNIYHAKEYGYWGHEIVGDKTILFSHGNIIDKALENYVKTNKLECGEFKNKGKEDSTGFELFKTLKKYYWDQDYK